MIAREIEIKDVSAVTARSKRGGFAHISDAYVEDWQSSIDIVLRRLAEYHDLRGAFGRRALTERAKGILLERHAIDQQSAHEILLERAEIAREQVDEVVLGCVRQARLGQNPALQVAIGAGIPKEVPATMINTLCGSGPKAVLDAPVTYSVVPRGPNSSSRDSAAPPGDPTAPRPFSERLGSGSGSGSGSASRVRSSPISA